MGQIITICNPKGGTAKTSTAINLACAMRAVNKKVQLVDFDPQGSASCALGFMQTDIECNLATAILDMSSTNSRSEGNLLAKEILSSLAKFTHVRKTSPIKASLAVLKAPDIPSLLIETGY